MNLLREKARCRPMGAAAYFKGGSSSSSAATTNTTEVYDNRVVGGDDSANVSASGGSSVTVISTDQGAVSGGLQLGGKAIDASVKQAEGLQTTVRGLFDGALKAVGDSNKTVASMGAQVAGDLAEAFTDAKAPDKNILIVGGVVVVGLAAVMVLAAKKG